MKTSKQLTLGTLLCALIALAGCSSMPTEEPSVLLDASEQTLASCSSVTSFSVKTPIRTLLFQCPSLGISNTIQGFKDAGWCVESIEIGEPRPGKEAVEMNLKIVIKKLL